MYNEEIMKIWFLALGVFFGVLFLAFTKTLHDDGMKQADFDTTVKVQNHVPEKYDYFLSFFSASGSFEVVTIILILFFFLVRQIKRSVFPFFLYALGHGIEIFGKGYLNHPGPPFLFQRTYSMFAFPSSYVETASSYPSGHSMRAMFLFLLLAFFLLRSKRYSLLLKILLLVLLLIYTGVMLFSRLSLGSHWTSDILGGSLLGLCLGFISFVSFPSQNPSPYK